MIILCVCRVAPMGNTPSTKRYDSVATSENREPITGNTVTAQIVLEDLMELTDEEIMTSADTVFTEIIDGVCRRDKKCNLASLEENKVLTDRLCRLRFGDGTTFLMRLLSATVDYTDVITRLAPKLSREVITEVVNMKNLFLHSIIKTNYPLAKILWDLNGAQSDKISPEIYTSTILSSWKYQHAKGKDCTALYDLMILMIASDYDLTRNRFLSTDPEMRAFLVRVCVEMGDMATLNRILATGDNINLLIKGNTHYDSYIVDLFDRGELEKISLLAETPLREHDVVTTVDLSVMRGFRAPTEGRRVSWFVLTILGFGSVTRVGMKFPTDLLKRLPYPTVDDWSQDPLYVALNITTGSSNSKHAFVSHIVTHHLDTIAQYPRDHLLRCIKWAFREKMSFAVERLVRCADFTEKELLMILVCGV